MPQKQSLLKLEGKDYVELVDPLIGTAGHGHTYPGVSLPFGMVQLSPDTGTTEWDWCSGYHYTDKSIIGFSHTHLSGTGCGDYGDILIMPTVGKLQLSPGEKENPDAGYRSRFSHEKEIACLGYYSVLLDDYNIKAELTSTKRVGFHKYTFPKSDNANIIIDLTHSIDNVLLRQKITDLELTFVSDTEIVGLCRTEGWAKDQRVYFAAKFSKPFKSFGITVDGHINPGLKHAKADNMKGFVGYTTAADEQILVKVGISAVSAECARKNLESEIADWNFDRVRNQARQIWNQQLTKIQVEGGTKQQQRTFYTALYHASLVPNLFMDVDGKYRGVDHKIHTAEGFENYTAFSLWDTFRAVHPLFTIIERERTVDFIKTLIGQYENGGRLPRWELAGNYTGCMIGNHVISIIVDAYLKGIRGFDIDKAYEAMKHNIEQDEMGQKYYRQLGYIPHDKEHRSVTKLLEYAYDDWCMAQIAKALGKDDDYKLYRQRSQNYKNVYDPSTGFMRGKDSQGNWVTPFDPKFSTYEHNPYAEGNAWQYVWFVLHDVPGLIDLMGGKEKFTEKLDGLFIADASDATLTVDQTGLIGLYAQGNEPSHHIAYLYNYAGKPWKTQQRVHQIMTTLYTDKPDGLCGNEDCGQMSSWYVLSAIGFYPVCPAMDIYSIGSPIFPKVTIDQPYGKQFVIEAKNVSDANKYIQSATRNGKPYTKSYIKHADILDGAKFEFVMGPEPNPKWGSGETDIPYSLP